MHYRTMGYNTYGVIYNSDGDNLSRWENYFNINYKNHLPSINSNIMEIGSGNGVFIGYLIKNNYVNVIGVDLVESNIDSSKNTYGADHFILGDGLDYLVASRQLYDMVCLFDVLEHLKKDEILAFLGNIYNKLSDSGYILARIPNGESPFVGADFFGDLTHETLLTRTSVKHIGEICGFRKTHVYPCYDIPRVNLSRDYKLLQTYILLLRYALRKVGLFFIKLAYYGKGAILTNNINIIFYK